MHIGDKHTVLGHINSDGVMVVLQRITGNGPRVQLLILNPVPTQFSSLAE